ncbi:hypothetical protein [Amycolatopsis vastitatis]|uniref:Uncharacterized protein n=1 Tax=Amycolatopsis vastitatis TaxID=1905142 RepID=A0A229TEJ5_9PSEU|nr:hypothetical protein [Amycolatopsis vastitatis]OXM69667.1 hypothetical protein CF165_09160 [Amycolatopsis vastitatis]
MNPDEPNREPQPRSSAPDDARHVALDPHADLLQKWRRASSAAGRARAELDRIETELLILLGDADVGTLNGLPAVVREIEQRPGIDIPRLRRDHPDLWTQYQVTRSRPHLKFPRKRRTT